jgi:hypothetical protein
MAVRVRKPVRVTRAAKQVCGFVNGSIIPVSDDYRNCFGEALNGARTDLSAMAQRQG